MSTPNPAGRRGRRARDVLEPLPETVPQQSQLVDPPQPETPAELPAAIEQPKPSTELTLPERALAAMKLAVTVDQLTALAASTATITAITNTDGRKQAHAAAMALADQRLEIKKAGEMAREDAVKFQKEVINQVGKMVALIEPEEKRLLKLRDDWDTARENERKAKAEAEARRLAAIHERIQAIRDTLTDCAGKDAAGIQSAIVATTALAIDESYGDLKGLAENVQANVLARLRAMHGDRVKLEEERAAQAAEQAKRKAELDAEIAKQRAERQLTNERLAKIRAIGNLVLVATTGRSPDRKAGTRDCIVATLAELRDIPVDESTFGDMLQSAVAAWHAAIEQVEHILQRFDERAAETLRRAEDERVSRLNQMRMAEIQGIADQVLLATTGRIGGAPSGTRECLVERLAETRAMPVGEDKFGELAGAAHAARVRACDQIQGLLDAFDERERQRLEQQRIDREREAAQAEQRRIAEENARQAQDLQRQREELAEAERLHAQSLAAAEADRQALVTPAAVLSSLEVANANAREFVDRISAAPVVPVEFTGPQQPSAESIIDVVAGHWGVGPDMAAKWCRDAFAPACLSNEEETHS